MLMTFALFALIPLGMAVLASTKATSRQIEIELDTRHSRGKIDRI